MGTPVVNFGKVTVAGSYDAAATSIVLSAGHGSRLPSTFPYPLTWWEASTYSDPSDDPNRELVQVTSRAGDTLTVVRAHEGTTASTKNTAGKTYKMLATVTKAMWDAIQTRRTATQTFRGLRVQTHPDADKALSQVVFSADSIVMDDGEEVQDWTKIVVDVTASGVNGLDTGTESANVLYELWAIYNGTTKAGVLHRAKDYLLDEEVSAGEDGQHLLRDATARTKLAQGVQVDSAGLLEFVDVKLVKVGAPTGQYWVTVEANSGGVPSNTPLATSDKYDVSRLTTTAGWVRLPFRTPAALSASTQYHLVLQGDFTVSAVNHLGWRADTTAAPYARGAKAAFDGSTWTTDTDDDFMVRVYMTRNDTAVSLPGGYTQQALIGFVVNNGSSHFKPFVQQGRTVQGGYSADWKLGAITALTLVSVEGFLPPRPVRLVGLSYNSGAGHSLGLGPLSATDLDGTASVEVRGAIKAYVASSEIGVCAPIPIEYAGMQAIVTAGIANLYVAEYEW